MLNFDWLPYGGKKSNTGKHSSFKISKSFIRCKRNNGWFLFALVPVLPHFNQLVCAEQKITAVLEWVCPAGGKQGIFSRAYAKTLFPFFSLLVIPKVTKHLLSNPVFTCIILAACMEIAVVAGFAAFLGKYLEQQFNLTTSSANQLLGE